MSGRKKEDESPLIREMQAQLVRLQEQRKELEQSRRELQDDDEDVILHRPILPHLTGIMRDRRLAQIRLLVQRNMHAMDKDIQNTIRRLGTAILDDDDDDGRRTGCQAGQKEFPDLIPRRSAVSTPSRHLPPAGSSKRQALLEAVKETLGRRIQLKTAAATTPVMAEEEEDGGGRCEPAQSPRVGFYTFSHETSCRKPMKRLSVQQLPSVTIESKANVARAQVGPPTVIDVQSRSMTPERSEATVDSAAASQEMVDSIRPEDVARIVSDILADQLDLAFDAFDNVCEHEQRERDCPSSPVHQSIAITDSIAQLGHHPAFCNMDDKGTECDQFRLTIDTCTQTQFRNLRDSSTEMDTQPIDSPAPSTANPREQERRDEGEKEECLTPPRSWTHIAPDEGLPDLNLWRRRYPPTPPESVISAPEHAPQTETPVDVAGAVAATATTVVAPKAASSSQMMASSSSSSSSSSNSSLLAGTATTTNSSSDATGISSSSLASVGGVSWLSEGEVPNPVHSPGLVAASIPARLSTLIDRSDATSFSEGQVLLGRDLMSTPLDGPSEGEVMVANQPPPSARSDSTASFQSATGSAGEIEMSTTDEVVVHDLCESEG